MNNRERGMAEYIRKDVLARVYMAKGKDKLRLATVINELEMLPAEDVAPVRHARWVREVYTDPQGGEWTKYHCSLCGRVEIVEEPHCNCGAKMDLMEDV